MSLGSYKAGIVLIPCVAFNDDQGNAVDPTTPFANLKKADNTWVALSAPTKQNNSTGIFAPTIDTTGFASGFYQVEIGGTVPTAKTPKTVYSFQIIANDSADVMTRVGAPVGATISADLQTKLPTATYVAPDNTNILAIKGQTDKLTFGTGNKLAVQDPSVLPDNTSITAIKGQTDKLTFNDLNEVKAEATVNVDVPDVLSYVVPGNYATGTAGHILGAISGNVIEFVSPVSQDGKIIILERGNDYYAADSKALAWIETGGNWPDLTGATVNFICGTLTVAAIVVTPSGAGKQVQVELSKEQVNSISKKEFEIVATLANTHTRTLVEGKIVIE